MHRLRLPLSTARFRLFWSNASGVAAVEFALLVPLLMLMTFGTFEITRALIIHKRFQRATATVGDLVSRESQLWPAATDPTTVTTTGPAKATLKGIMTSVEHVMQPYGVDPLQVKVYQVWASMADGKQTKIEWSYQYRTEATVGCGTPKTLDAGLLSPNGRAIIVEAQYQYTPVLTNLLPSIIRQVTWSDTMIMTPRDVPSVLFLPALNNSATWASPSLAPCQ